MVSDHDFNRFWDLVDISEDPDTCWPWIGTMDKNRRGAFTLNKECKQEGLSRSAHRTAFILRYGLDALKSDKRLREPDLCVVHSCMTPNCCNLNHLYATTFQEVLKERRPRRTRMQIRLDNAPEWVRKHL